MNLYAQGSADPGFGHRRLFRKEEEKDAKIAMTPETKCVETLVTTAAAALIVLANKDLFLETRHVGKLPEFKCGDGATESDMF